MCIPQIPTTRNNTGFTDNSVFVNISGSSENLGFIDNSGLADNLVFTEKVNNLPSDDVGVSISSSKNAEKHEVPSVTLRHYKLNSFNKVVFAHINIYSIRNIIEDLKEIVQKNIDILTVSETKLDESFPTNQLYMNGYASPNRLDRSSDGRGILVYIRDDIPAKLLKNHPFPKCCEGMFIELKLRNINWQVFSEYNPYKRNISNMGKMYQIFYQYSRTHYF